MARIAKLDPDEMNAAQKRIHDDIVAGPRGEVVGPLGVWLHRPELADKAQKLGQYCRYDSSLEPRLSELAILVTARIWDAAFEWQSHEPMARAGGLDDAIIEALAKDQEPSFVNEDESVVYRISRSLNLERRISDALYSEGLNQLGKDGLIDLIGVLGYYSLISMTINAFEVDPLHE